MFQSYIKVIFSYLKLKLFYFILNLCIAAEQHFTPYISVVAIFHQFMDQAITDRGLTLQSNVVQARAGQDLQVQARTYIAVSQKRLTV